jgi:hypothetical protein
MNKVVFATLLFVVGFNSCATKKVCTNCTANIPEPQFLKTTTQPKFNATKNSGVL